MSLESSIFVFFYISCILFGILSMVASTTTIPRILNAFITFSWMLLFVPLSPVFELAGSWSGLTGSGAIALGVVVLGISGFAVKMATDLIAYLLRDRLAGMEDIKG